MLQTTRSTLAVVHADLTGVQTSGTQTFDTLFRVAQACHASGLFEDVSDEAQAFVKILKGQEMGLPPTTAMTAFDLIRKRLFIKPWVIAAKINACGYGSYRVTEQSTERCTILFSRRYPGQGWAACPPVSYTFTEAKAQGLTERSAHWKASPAHMLYQRCMGRGGAMYFPELLAGLTPPQDDTPIPAERHRQNIIDLFGDGAVATHTGELYGGDPPAASHPIWATIEGWYADAGQPEKYAQFEVWACKRYRVTSITAIGEADLEELGQKMYATLEPLILARQIAQGTANGQEEEGLTIGSSIPASVPGEAVRGLTNDNGENAESRGASWVDAGRNLFDEEAQAERDAMREEGA